MYEELDKIQIRAYNLLVMKKMWKKYRKTLGEENIGADKKKDENSFFQCINMYAREVNRSIALDNVKIIEEKAGEVENRTGISKDYLTGNTIIVVPSKRINSEKIIEYMEMKYLLHNVKYSLGKIKAKETKEVAKKSYRKMIIGDIFESVDIKGEYARLCQNMKMLHDIFEEQGKKDNEKRAKSRFNKFCKNVRDMLENKKDSLEEEKLMINSKTLKIAKDVKSNIMSIKKNINQTCSHYYDFEKELKKEINKIDINDINKEDDINLYRLMYYIVHNKKYDGSEK